ncbi:hypothetical protein PLIP_b0118 [Pseudoalteromonas lipolytica LMEB 39]|nr:hypothetical protein [Pseudoalteromonas lipolytica LMEB 39]
MLVSYLTRKVCSEKTASKHTLQALSLGWGYKVGACLINMA